MEKAGLPVGPGAAPTVTGRTRLAMVLGYPIGHSLSPAMHNAAFAATGLEAVYLPWAVPPAGLAEAVGALRRIENLLGANVTVPHKEAILPLVDEVEAGALRFGAINTLVVRDGRLVGHNTDAEGFAVALREEGSFDPEGRSALILGAGGGARAVAFALADGGVARLAILNRGPRRAEDLAQQVRASRPGLEVKAWALHDSSGPARFLGRCDLVVNCTPVGLRAEDPPLVPGFPLAGGCLVCDLIYNPPETPLLRRAREAGCRCLNGLGMLLYQGAAAFELWTGLRAPVAAMRRALGEALFS